MQIDQTASLDSCVATLYATGRKHKLKNFLLHKVTPCETLPNDSTAVIGRGAFLFARDWRKGELFHKYAQKCHKLSVNVVVFDGYESSSTKDSTRIK